MLVRGWADGYIGILFKSRLQTSAICRECVARSAARRGASPSSLLRRGRSCRLSRGCKHPPRQLTPRPEVGTQEFRARSQGALDPWGDQTLRHRTNIRQPCSHIWCYSRSLEPALGKVHVHVVQYYIYKYKNYFLQVCMFPPLAETHISYLTCFVQKRHVACNSAYWWLLC